jgi:hypothetical protein
VTNPGRLRLESYDNKGNLRSFWGKASMSIDGFCGCCNPTHFALTRDGYFVTSEKGIPRIKIVDPAGQLHKVVALADQFDENTEGIDIVCDPNGRIIALDPVRKQLRIYIEKETL